MISIQKIGDNYNRQILRLIGKSTDVKPIITFGTYTLMNGDVYHEMDTNKDYLYDEESNSWLEQIFYMNNYFEIKDITIDDESNLLISY